MRIYIYTCMYYYIFRPIYQMTPNIGWWTSLYDDHSVPVRSSIHMYIYMYRHNNNNHKDGMTHIYIYISFIATYIYIYTYIHVIYICVCRQLLCLSIYTHKSTDVTVTYTYASTSLQTAGYPGLTGVWVLSQGWAEGGRHGDWESSLLPRLPIGTSAMNVVV